MTIDGSEWKSAVRARILTARAIVLRHPWAPGVFESRPRMGPPIVGYFNALLGLLIQGGFSYDRAHHALHALGSRALGFGQELFQPSAGDADANPAEMLPQKADQVPYLVGMLQEIVHYDPDSTLGWCDDQAEFEFARDLLLDGLERRRAGA